MALPGNFSQMTISPIVNIETESDIRINRSVFFFWFGFLIYCLSYTISTSGSVNFIICQSLQILGLLLIVPAAWMLMQWKFDTNYLKIAFTTYICWLFTVIIRGFLFDYQFLKFILFDATFGIFLYFAPLILLVPRELRYYKVVFDVILVLSLACIVFDMLFIKDLLYPGRNLKAQAIIEYFSIHLSLSSGFLLVTYMYHSKTRRLLALFIIVLTFMLAAVRARRGLMFMSVNILVFAFFIYYYANKVKLLLFMFSIVLVFAVYLLGAKIYNANRNGLFGYITERIDEKTRTGVEVYFYNDMNTVDWIIGRGFSGEYYCPLIIEGALVAHRGIIETGFLQIILKGGIISLGLLLLIILPAIIKGIFYSKNMLSKAAGIWIFLFLINMYPAIPTNFSMSYLLVWISVGICYSKEIRDTPELVIIEKLSAR